jgi:hypothetical protein
MSVTLKVKSLRAYSKSSLIGSSSKLSRKAIRFPMLMTDHARHRNRRSARCLRLPKQSDRCKPSLSPWPLPFIRPTRLTSKNGPAKADSPRSLVFHAGTPYLADAVKSCSYPFKNKLQSSLSLDTYNISYIISPQFSFPLSSGPS